MSHKIQIKLGQFEFSAEGDEATVKDQYARFMSFVDKTTQGNPAALVEKATPVKNENGDKAEPIDNKASGNVSNVDYEKIFSKDPTGVSLKIHPDGKAGDDLSQARYSMLLILYGYKNVFGKEMVSAVGTSASMKKSGIGFRRLDVVADGLYSDNLINKTGQRRGVQYNITNKGSNEAEKIIREMRIKY
ncbi:MAG TPA: hypothetical protein P5079_05235 [Elusimicrobiota bacterium]|nr:hypothetical protein [Elusimicrobiota bacterium]